MGSNDESRFPAGCEHEFSRNIILAAKNLCTTNHDLIESHPKSYLENLSRNEHALPYIGVYTAK